MLIPAVQLRRIVDGSVDLAFRRWASPRVRVGTRLRTQVGVIEVTGLSRTTLAAIGAEELRRAGLRSKDERRRHLRPNGDLYRIELRYAGADPRIALRADAALTDADIAALRERLARYDRASTHGVWTERTLAAIRERRATLAAELAADLGLEVVVFKRDVRKLKGWDELRPFLETGEGFWSKVMEINFMGAVRVTHAVLPGMVERGSGRLVNVASDAGRVGSSLESVYSGAKGGLIAFTKTIAREVARNGITANAVCPGPTRTPLLEKMTAEGGERLVDALTRAVPMRRLAEPEDVAAAVGFLASERAGYITGQTLSVSGGLTMA